MPVYANKQLNNDAAYIRRELQPLADRVVLPDSLQARVLCAKLEGIEPQGVKKRREERVRRFPRQLFSLQSGLTYAAAFALMLALFYGMGLHRPQLITGDIPLETQRSTGSAESAQMERAALESPAPAQVESDEATLFSAQHAAPEMAASQQVEAGGVGGAGKAVPLGEVGTRKYLYRINDATDPDKQGFPLTIDIVDATADELLGQIDVPDLYGVQFFSAQPEAIVLAGEAETGVVVRAYSVVDAAQPYELAVVTQPGAFVAAREYQGVVHVATRTAQQPEMDIVPLPGAVQEEYIVLSALDIAQGATAQKAFAISHTGELLLYNRNAYLRYTGGDESEADDGVLVAQIRLDGLQMELGSVSQDTAVVE